MKFTGSIYRPPLEASTPLLQVTSGCAHNKCTFCTMYINDAFSIETLEQIEKDVKELKSHHNDLRRIFLVNGDAFVLSAKKLKAISDIIIKYFPNMETITMYASISNIRSKTDEELLQLKEARINDLWLGIETGHNETLKLMNKGHTTEEAYFHLDRLNKAGIRHLHGLMIGLGGKGLGEINAIETAKLVNETKPGLIWICSTGIFEGSRLTRLIDEGTYTPATELEILEEEIKLLELIDLKNIKFYSNHPTNTVKFYGTLPSERHQMINLIKDRIESSDNNVLNQPAQRLSL